MPERYPWWGYVRYMARKYPDWSTTPRNKIPCKENECFDAVRCAVEKTERMRGGLARIRVIRLVHWDKTHTLEGAALSIPCGRATAARWQRDFFEEVARNLGLLD